jgi:hypothetical protein
VRRWPDTAKTLWQAIRAFGDGDNGAGLPDLLYPIARMTGGGIGAMLEKRSSVHDPEPAHDQSKSTTRRGGRNVNHHAMRR